MEGPRVRVEREDVEELIERSYDRTAARILEMGASEDDRGSVDPGGAGPGELLRAYRNYYAGFMEGAMFVEFRRQFGRAPDLDDKRAILRSLGPWLDVVKRTASAMAEKRHGVGAGRGGGPAP